MLFELGGQKSFSILLISPADFGSYRSSTFITENLGIANLASYLNHHGIRVTICDARSFGMSPQNAINAIKDKKIDLVGLSISSRNGLFWSKEFAQLFKQIVPDVHITAGGQFPTLETVELFEAIPELDSVIMGEGEIPLLNLCNAFIEKRDWRNIKALSRASCITQERDVPINLNSLPFPYRYLAPEKDESFEVLLEGSRGCVFWCTFCAIRPFLGKTVRPSWRIRSADSLIKEIQCIKQKNNRLKRFRFIDSDFIGPPNNPRALRFAELAKTELKDAHFHMEGRAASIIKNRSLLFKLKEAGLRRIYVGIESGSQRILDKMNKNTTVEENKQAIDLLKELNIDFSYGFIMFTPWTIDEDVEDNLASLRYFGKIQMNKLFHELFLIKGTRAYEEIAKTGSPQRSGDSGYYTYPSLTKNVGKIREIGTLLENGQVEFMQQLWFLYKRLRQLSFTKAPVQQLEKEVDHLFLDIFQYCWGKIKNDSEIDTKLVVNECIGHFTPKMQTLSVALHSNEIDGGVVDED